MRKRPSVEQITAIQKQAELRTAIADLCCKPGASEQSFSRWKKVHENKGPSSGRPSLPPADHPMQAETSPIVVRTEQQHPPAVPWRSKIYAGIEWDSS